MIRDNEGAEGLEDWVARPYIKLIVEFLDLWRPSPQVSNRCRPQRPRHFWLQCEIGHTIISAYRRLEPATVLQIDLRRLLRQLFSSRIRIRVIELVLFFLSQWIETETGREEIKRLSPE